MNRNIQNIKTFLENIYINPPAHIAAFSYMITTIGIAFALVLGPPILTQLFVIAVIFFIFYPIFWMIAELCNKDYR